MGDEKTPEDLIDISGGDGMNRAGAMLDVVAGGIAEGPNEILEEVDGGADSIGPIVNPQVTDRPLLQAS